MLRVVVVEEIALPATLTRSNYIGIAVIDKERIGGIELIAPLQAVVNLLFGLYA